MSRMHAIKEVANSVLVHEDTIRNWIKNGMINAIVMDGLYYIREADVEKAREIAESNISERMKKESHRQHIPYLYRLCANDKFEEVALALELSDIPKTCAECYSIIERTRKQKDLNSIKENE